MHHTRRVWVILAGLLMLRVLTPVASAQLGSIGWEAKLDPVLQRRATLLTGETRVVVRAIDSASLPLIDGLIRQVGGVPERVLPIVDAQAARVPNTALPLLAASSLVLHLSLDRVAAGALERTGATIGTTALRAEGYDGTGVGIAIIDSGVTPWHDDLAESGGETQRVARFVDFVNGREAAFDDYGHGTHVAGIIAGNGFDSAGARSGVAPAAHLVVLKVLDATGRGRISDVIAALDYVAAHKDALNIRVVNLSIAAAVYESYSSDPLTLAAERVAAAGVVVVAAAGNNGRSPDGETQYGGVTAPGNAPWVLTVGASSHAGTIDRRDDTVATFSSRGPGAVDAAAKPDLVAPGVGIESLSDPQSAFYTTKSPYLLPGMVPKSYLPYLSLSGTSMAAPVVSGTVALMLLANPALTPNAVKALLQYTAEAAPGPDALTQGAGFLNAKGAVELASYFAAPDSSPYPDARGWSGRLIWGNYLLEGGRLTSDASAWAAGLVWGSGKGADGQPVSWGVICSTGTCEGSGTWSRWGASCGDAGCSSVTFGNARNVVWGSRCGGGNCESTWTGTDEASGAIVVWVTSGDEQFIVVWGTTCSDPSCEPVIWNSQ